MIQRAGGLADDSAPLHTSRRIERAALELFFERGFKATTMREIALACGLTPGALYNHYPSKDQLLSTIIARVHEELERDLRDAMAAAGDDIRDRVAAYVRAHVLFHTHSRKEARVANQEINSLPGPERALIIEQRRRMRRELREMLERGAELGAFSVPDSTVVANAILNIGIRVADWFVPEGRLSADEVAELHAELALRMVNATR